ncbi:MAG: response regulator [Lachnospiraceae bacterium]|nr:response regulator [Lachnospiraceae bacterium]
MMKVLITDDEKMMRIGMEKEVKKVLPDADIFLAESGKEALRIFDEEDISLVFLDVEMPGMSGLEVAKHLKERKATVNIVMTTAYPNYAVDAYRLHIGGYLMKPVDADDIREELEHLAHPIEENASPNRLRLQCFGEFRAEYDGKPLHFSRSKSKEILAYLTAKNGASASRNELCNILWEDEERESKKSYIRVLMMELKNTLKEIGFEDVLTHNRNEYSLKTNEVYCDYYEFLKGNPSAIRAYQGEFMNQYSWGEEFIWDLENKYQ